MGEGLKAMLPLQNSSELVFIEERSALMPIPSSRLLNETSSNRLKAECL